MGSWVLDSRFSETEIVVDGQKIKTTTTEAMNAFYTYQNTVMASRIEAQYLADTYGIEIDYTQLVKNANGTVSKEYVCTRCLKSGKVERA